LKPTYDFTDLDENTTVATTRKEIRERAKVKEEPTYGSDELDAYDPDSVSEDGNDEEVISLPNNWAPRHYQAPLIDYLMEDGERKRAVCVWHRRAGKDSTCLNIGAIMSQLRVGTIWHMLPTLQQARRVIWDGIDRDGRKMIDQAFPKEMRSATNNSEMKITMLNGSIWQCVGSDNYDSLVGTNPVGVIFSEYSICDPTAWDYIRPILAENGGWAMFIYTPRGKNHGHTLFKMAETNDNWFCSELTIDDTFRAPDIDDLEGYPHVINPEDIEEERLAGMAEEKILQEFYCSWDTGLEGAFYTKALNNMSDDLRIGEYPHDPSKPVQTWWDIGISDHTAVIFTQVSEAGHPIIIDCLSKRNMSLEEWIRDVKSCPYVYDSHNGPHDMEQREFTSGKTRKDFASSLGFHFDIVPKLPLMDGIDATRASLRTATMDENKCAGLLDALYSYRREFDDKSKMFKDKPFHDHASHYADAMRYLAVGWQNAGSNVGWGVKKSDNYRSKHKVKTAYKRR